jgi:stage IV sporulation protein A
VKRRIQLAENVLHNLVKRTNGDVYIGVVGPVRVGKSVLVKKLMEMLLLPNITDEDLRLRTLDEMPQSSPGPVIMTSEPKFVPAQAVSVQTEQLDVPFRVRFADCVGYIIDGAQGYEHDGKAKYVSTPWHHEAIPFREAAKIGTDKVIRDHATIGIVVTTDGTVNGFTRESVQQAEEEIIEQLQQIGKPFIVVVNSTNPRGAAALEVKSYLMQKYNVPVLVLNIEQLNHAEVNELLSEALLEFPIHQILLNKPDWIDALDEGSQFHQEIQAISNEIDAANYKVREIEAITEQYLSIPFVKSSELYEVDTSSGQATIQLLLHDHAFTQACEDVCEQELSTKKEWLTYLKEAAAAKKTQQRFQQAIIEAEENGYGIAFPSIQQFSPEEPELIEQNNFYGVRMRTTAPSYHIIRVDLDAEFAPLIGSKFHSQQLLSELQKGYETDHQSLWNISLFGTPLYDVLIETMKHKMNEVPATAKSRMRQTIERMVNEGEKGLITFIL